MILEIKQIGKFNDRDTKSEYGEYTMLPFSARSFVIKRGINGRYVTGLTEEKQKEFEALFGEDLSPLSNFWRNYNLMFRMPEGSMKLNLEDPKQELFYLVATANKLLAPDRQTLKDDHSFKNNTIFYVYDKEGLEKKAQLLQELKDEIAGLMFNFSKNREKMLFIGHALGLFVTDSFKADSLYSLLSKYRDKLSTHDQLESFKKVITRPNEELQADYYVRQGLKHSIISFDTNVNKYRFQEKHIGKIESEVLDYFKAKKNEPELAALIMEVKDKQK